MKGDNFKDLGGLVTIGEGPKEGFPFGFMEVAEHGSEMGWNRFWSMPDGADRTQDLPASWRRFEGAREAERIPEALRKFRIVVEAHGGHSLLKESHRDKIHSIVFGGMMRRWSCSTRWRRTI